MFDNIIGQEKIKKRLEFFVQGQESTGVSPHVLFVAPKGSGKTLIAQTYASCLRDSDGKRRKLLTINCASLLKLKQFVNDLLVPHVQDKEVTILFDEASEIPKDVSMGLLTILNPNRENKTSFSYGDFTIDFDFRKVTFLFATTEAHRIFHALTDRLERVDLEEYSLQDLSTIVQKNTIASIDAEAMAEISKVLRGNARQAIRMAGHLSSYITASKKDSFDIDDWPDFCIKTATNSLGLSHQEIKVLKCLSERTETTLTTLSAKTSLTRQTLQRDTESYLQKLNLMDVTPTGRALTHRGRAYLTALAK
jgi:Holliday junction resolvasome RuvABC ATP-dependent DNA helicase subunit